MKVTQFFMGFGPRVWSMQRGEVEYGIRALPLGAFVRIVGMNNLDECDPADEPRAYRAQSYPKRLLVITAGSLMHGVIALVLFFGVYATSGRYSETGDVLVTSPPAANSPAQQSGVVMGDVVREIDGIAISTREQFVEQIVSKQPGQTVPVVVERAGKPVLLNVTLGNNPVDTSLAYFGVASWSLDYVSVNPIKAVGYAAQDLVVSAGRSVVGVFVVLNPINIFNSVVDDKADPATRPSTIVGASQLGGEIGR